MKLTHAGISRFRSIGSDPVVIDLTKKINVLVGANNCGKSNVLLALSSFGQKTENELDMHLREKGVYPVYWVGAKPDEESPALLQKLGPVFFGRQQTSNGESVQKNPFRLLDWSSFHNYWQQIHPGNYYSGWPGDAVVEEEKTKTSLRLFTQLAGQFPPTVRIPQFRQIAPAEEYSVSGNGIVNVLARWQHPKIGEDAKRERFLKIQNLLRVLIESPSVSLEVEHDAAQIVVSNGVLRLPLESYGTGIHQLIILSIAVLGHENSLVLIEEPEIHLHPLLQRRLLDFLRRETTNRYVVTTHSSALIAPAQDIAVTHLWTKDGVTASRLVETTGHSLEALRDLGVRASDILQANSVIWVEGPSDRIYLNRWLELLFPGEFREGIDYAIMFYGGRLLAHVALDRDDTEADDLVHLLQINQHSAILIDSDRRKGADEINATKRRVRTECGKSGSLCWVTDGREIENYLPPAAVAAAYEPLISKRVELKIPRYGSLEDALKRAVGKRNWKSSWSYNNAKPQRAREIIPHITKESISDEVVTWLKKVAKVIRHEV